MFYDIDVAMERERLTVQPDNVLVKGRRHIDVKEGLRHTHAVEQAKLENQAQQFVAGTAVWYCKVCGKTLDVCRPFYPTNQRVVFFTAHCARHADWMPKDSAESVELGQQFRAGLYVGLGAGAVLGTLAFKFLC